MCVTQVSYQTLSHCLQAHDSRQPALIFPTVPNATCRYLKFNGLFTLEVCVFFHALHNVGGLCWKNQLGKLDWIDILFHFMHLVIHCVNASLFPGGRRGRFGLFYPDQSESVAWIPFFYRISVIIWLNTVKMAGQAIHLGWFIFLYNERLWPVRCDPGGGPQVQVWVLRQTGLSCHTQRHLPRQSLPDRCALSVPSLALCVLREGCPFSYSRTGIRAMLHPQVNILLIAFINNSGGQFYVTLPWSM